MQKPSAFALYDLNDQLDLVVKGIDVRCVCVFVTLQHCHESFALQLVELFGGVRDDWMKADIQGWLSMNRFYPEAAELLRHAIDKHQTYIVTTKQA